MKNNLSSTTLYYHEELDADGSLLSHEWIESFAYKNGEIIKSVYIDEKGNRIENICFAQTKEN